MEPQQFSETKLSPKKFIEKACIQAKKIIPHKNLLPECKNVTKQNCVLTNREKDSYGNRVCLGIFEIHYFSRKVVFAYCSGSNDEHNDRFYSQFF